MAVEKKRLTAAEVRHEQELREKSDVEAQALARQEEQRHQQEREEQNLRTLANGIKANWHDGVQAAATRTGIRFLVLAQVVSDANRHPVMAELVEAIQAEGFGCEVTSLQSAARGGTVTVFDDKIEAEVLLGAVHGWKPPSLPRLGGKGPITYLIVRWD
jgi:hypothetical protein